MECLTQLLVLINRLLLAHFEAWGAINIQILRHLERMCKSDGIRHKEELRSFEEALEIICAQQVLQDVVAYMCVSGQLG
jgi:hypothetical protein